jgi:hypothetical protein
MAVMSYEGLTKREALEELRVLARLHEAATDRNVALAAKIEEAKAWKREYADELTGTTFVDLARILDSADTERALRVVRHRLLCDIAAELEAKIPGVTVGAPWLRKRAVGILVGVDRSLDKHRAGGERSA